jgi:asparagine synthase (glutamine-hydrolysing)
MCGIAGIISRHPAAISKMSADLRSMTDALVHRGPEGEGFWINDNGHVGLGHRRLKIIDLSDSAAQPMHYNDRYAITYNGEIYNYPELKKELTSKNYLFKTASDTEVILAAYAHWKEECLNHFDGMFSFAIWDKTDQVLFCARDRFGEKPFYFFADDDGFLFASEMKALWAAGVPRKIQNAQLLNYIALGLVQNVARPDLTFFEDIYSLQPGHFLKLRSVDFDMQIKNYWDIDKETTDLVISERDAIDKFSFLLNRSVQRRLRSDVVLGTSLSGGLDSSSIVSLICSIKENETSIPALQTFSAIFPGFEKDESGYIKEMVQKFPIQNHQTTPVADELVRDFDRLMYFQEEPFQSFSIYAQYRVYELAKQQGVKVILDGQGADEILAGYHKYYPWYWQELYRKNPASATAARHAAMNLDNRIPWGVKNKLAAYLPALAARQLEKKALRQLRDHPFIENNFKSELDRLAFSKPVIRKLNDILYFHTNQLGLQELLRYADRNSMAHGREVRLPFLEHELVQFLFLLPSHFKIKDGWLKWILRSSMRNQLPEQILWRKDKVGFEPPQLKWIQNKRMTDKIMESRRILVKENILKPAVMLEPLQAKAAHEDGNDDFRFLCAASLLQTK